MTKEQIREYTARVAQANRSELVVILYELILDSVEESVRLFEGQQKEQAAAEIKKAQAYLQELLGSLDRQYELSGNLYSLYRYVNEQFITTLLRQKPVNLDSVCRVIHGLMESFQEVAKQDTSGPVMEHAQQIYAGLTYGKGTLNEVSVSNHEVSRGYQV